jgi:hypothetical protein
MTILLQYKHPFAYLVLLVIVILVRIPGFHPDFLTYNESMLLVSADRLLDGFTLYQNIITDDPPLTVFLYAGLRFLFEEHFVMSLRIISVVYLFLCAVVFNQFVNDLKLQKYRSLLPGFWIILACSFPWHTAGADGDFFSMMPALFSVYLLVKTFEEQNDNMKSLMYAGILTSIAFLLNYQTSFLYFAIPLMYFILRPAKMSEITSLCIGFFIPLMGMFSFFYLNGNLKNWLDVSILHQVDKILVSDLDYKAISYAAFKTEVLWSFSGIIIPALGGLIAMRSGILRLNILQRKIDSAMGLWLIFAVITLFVNGIYQYQNPFLLIVFPLAFYIYRFFISAMYSWMKNTLFIILLSYPTFSAFQYYQKTNGKPISGYPEDPAWTAHLSFVSSSHTTSTLLLKALLPFQVQNGNQSIWIADPDATFYYCREKLRPGSRYIDFNLFANKASILPGNTYQKRLSVPIQPSALYLAFQYDSPDWIVDTKGIFSVMKEQIPILFKQYTLMYESPYHKIYQKN